MYDSNTWSIEDEMRRKTTAITIKFVSKAALLYRVHKSYLLVITTRVGGRST